MGRFPAGGMGWRVAGGMGWRVAGGIGWRVAGGMERARGGMANCVGSQARQPFMARAKAAPRSA